MRFMLVFRKCTILQFFGNLFFVGWIDSLSFHLMILIYFMENRFRPRILIDVSKIDMTTTVLGFKISMPIMIAPTAMQKMAHPEGICTWLKKSGFC